MRLDDVVASGIGQPRVADMPFSLSIISAWQYKKVKDEVREDPSMLFKSN